ncbi:hypothetical protein [Helcococcus kunzii]|uniref:hypothetical protein n=1 Tax=Helcococcus kunzii TaxID=40091 RepID=UPI0024AE3380|nr:hypothetical protein [Helcococcus kunzii]
MDISFETINKRLGYDFLESVREYYKNVETEYDGKKPIDNLTEDEKKFYEDYINDRLEK